MFDAIAEEHAERSAKVIKPGNRGFDVDRTADLGVRFELFGAAPSAADLALLSQLTVRLDHVVPFADAAKADELVESKRTTGKVVLVPRPVL